MQVQNNKEEVPFAHYAEKFRALDPAEAAARCKFRDCTHTHEPGCAVRAGVESGELDPGRVANYLKLHDEADRTAMLARKRARMKEISKFNHANRRD